MKHFSLVVFFLHFCVFNLSLAWFSSKELEIFTVFFKPYGISLKDDSTFMKVTRNLGQCSAFNETFKDCNLIIVNLRSSTTENELSKLTSLWKSCPSGSYACFNYAVRSHSLLKEWLVKVQNATKELCKKKCWQTLEKLVNSCIQPGKSGIKKSDRTDALFISELLKSLCIQDGKLSCADKFISGLLEQNSSSEACPVKTHLLGNNCSSNCYKDLLQFYRKVGCCVGSVSSIMECYSIKPQSGSYGIFVKEGNSRCHKKRPSACSQDTKINCPSQLQASPTPTRSVISSKGNLIAGVCIAVFICIGGAFIVGNFLYRRMKRREKIRFEDYGYSRLKMLEDEFYFDVEVDDTDDERGLVQL